jgi:hypothetical protein
MTASMSARSASLLAPYFIRDHPVGDGETFVASESKVTRLQASLSGADGTALVHASAVALRTAPVLGAFGVSLQCCLVEPRAG